MGPKRGKIDNIAGVLAHVHERLLQAAQKLNVSLATDRDLGIALVVRKRGARSKALGALREAQLFWGKTGSYLVRADARAAAYAAYRLGVADAVTLPKAMEKMRGGRATAMKNMAKAAEVRERVDQVFRESKPHRRVTLREAFEKVAEEFGFTTEGVRNNYYKHKRQLIKKANMR